MLNKAFSIFKATVIMLCTLLTYLLPGMAFISLFYIIYTIIAVLSFNLDSISYFYWAVENSHTFSQVTLWGALAVYGLLPIHLCNCITGPTLNSYCFRNTYLITHYNVTIMFYEIQDLLAPSEFYIFTAGLLLFYFHKHPSLLLLALVVQGIWIALIIPIYCADDILKLIMGLNDDIDIEEYAYLYCRGKNKTALLIFCHFFDILGWLIIILGFILVLVLILS